VSYPSFALGGFAYLKEGMSNTFREEKRQKKKKRKKDERKQAGRVISHRNTPAQEARSFSRGCVH